MREISCIEKRQNVYMRKELAKKKAGMEAPAQETQLLTRSTSCCKKNNLM